MSRSWSFTHPIVAALLDDEAEGRYSDERDGEQFDREERTALSRVRGLRTELEELQIWRDTNRPVLVGETAQVLGDGLVPALVDQSVTSGLVAGWAVIYNEQSLSKNWLEFLGPTLGVYLNGRLWQSQGREHAVP